MRGFKKGEEIILSPQTKSDESRYIEGLIGTKGKIIDFGTERMYVMFEEGIGQIVRYQDAVTRKSVLKIKIKN